MSILGSVHPSFASARAVAESLATQSNLAILNVGTGSRLMKRSLRKSSERCSRSTRDPPRSLFQVDHVRRTRDHVENGWNPVLRCALFEHGPHELSS